MRKHYCIFMIVLCMILMGCSKVQQAEDFATGEMERSEKIEQITEQTVIVVEAVPDLKEVLEKKIIPLFEEKYPLIQVVGSDAQTEVILNNADVTIMNSQKLAEQLIEEKKIEQVIDIASGYPAGIVTHTENRNAARIFLEYLSSVDAVRALEQAGFKTSGAVQP